MPVMEAVCSSLDGAYLPGLQPEGVRYFLEGGVILGKCPRGSL
jgi:hypothetical protein